MSSGSEQSGEHASDDMSRTVMMMDPEFSHRGCCFFIPRFNCWERMRGGGGSSSSTSDESGWAVRNWKRLREWSEIAAGPRWKTFIRKFGRRGNGGAVQGKFGYDALSYALNFDDGQNVQIDEGLGSRDFSTRFAPFPVSAKSSMDFGRDGPSFT
ncbi:hypothetical protein V2J09_001287 [Rumex salicifolius]